MDKSVVSPTLSRSADIYHKKLFEKSFLRKAIQEFYNLFSYGGF